MIKTEAFERSRHDRKRVEMLFAHLKRILRLSRLRLRGPCCPVRVYPGCDRRKPSPVGQAGRASAAADRSMYDVNVRSSPCNVVLAIGSKAIASNQVTVTSLGSYRLQLSTKFEPKQSEMLHRGHARK